MAEFFADPGKQNTAPDFRRFSEGFRNNAQGAFAKNLAGALNDGIAATDRTLAQRAKEQTEEVVVEADKVIMGIDKTEPAEDPIGRDIAKQMGIVARKKRQVDQGVISPDHYNAFIQAKLKEVRSSYAGYNDVIDRELKRNGINPNFQRDEIIAQAARNKSKADDEDRFNRQLFKEALRIPLDQDLREMVVQQGAHKNPELVEQVKVRINQFAASEARMRADVMATNLAAKRQEITQKQTEAKVSMSVNGAIDDLLVNSMSKDRIDRLRASISEDQANNKAPDQNEVARLQALTADLKNAVFNRVNGILNQYGPSLSRYPEMRQKVLAGAMGVADLYDKTISTGETTTLKLAIDGARTRNQLNINSMLDNPEIAKAAAIKNTMGEVWLNKYVARGGKTSATLNAFDSVTFAATTAHLVDDRVASYAEAQSKAQAEMSPGTEVSPGFWHESVKIHQDAIVEADSDVARVNAARKFVGPRNNVFWENLLNNQNTPLKDKKALLHNLYKPSTMRSMEKLKSQDPALYKRYLELGPSLMFRLNNPAVQSVNDFNAGSSDGVIRMSKEGRLFVEPTDRTRITTENGDVVARPGRDSLGAPGNFVVNIWEGLVNSGEQEAISSVNETLDVMEEIWKAQGKDIQLETARFLGGLGLNLPDTRRPNLMERGVKAVQRLNARQPLLESPEQATVEVFQDLFKEPEKTKEE